MSSGKKRNPLNLSLPPTVDEEESGEVVVSTESDGQEGSKVGKDGSKSLDSQLRQLSLSGSQEQRMNEWISQKKQVFAPIHIKYLPLRSEH
jgi:hypothetical protein